LPFEASLKFAGTFLLVPQRSMRCVPMWSVLVLASLHATAAAASTLSTYATQQAMAAAQCIVQTNQLLQLEAHPDAVICEGESCRPLRDALEGQRAALLPPQARSALAHARLTTAKTLLGVLDQPLLRTELQELLEALSDLSEKERDESCLSTDEHVPSLRALLDRSWATVQAAEAAAQSTAIGDETTPMVAEVTAAIKLAQTLVMTELSPTAQDIISTAAVGRALDASSTGADMALEGTSWKGRKRRDRRRRGRQAAKVTAPSEATLLAVR
jgi:hypothetical protein